MTISAKLIAAKRARRERKAAALAVKLANLTPTYSLPCARCGLPGPTAKSYSRRVKVCKECWRNMTQTEKRNLDGFAAIVG